MANSPLILPGGAQPEKSKGNRSKLSSTAVSSNAPTPNTTNGNNSSSAPIDLAEKMNNEEKNKYVKGNSPSLSPILPSNPN